jgi:hypothetical protein
MGGNPAQTYTTLYTFGTKKIVRINSHIMSAAPTLVTVRGEGEIEAKEAKAETKEAKDNQPLQTETKGTRRKLSWKDLVLLTNLQLAEKRLEKYKKINRRIVWALRGSGTVNLEKC